MTDVLRAAMVRFATLDPHLWPRAFVALRAMGFNAVDLPVVWRDHETSDGRLDLAAGRRSVSAALDAVASAGLRAIVRVGPINAPDAHGLGLPERILLDRRFQARTRRQNPVLVPDLPRLVPLPSLASVDFLREASTWVRAVCVAVMPFIASGVVARLVVGYGPRPLVRDDPWELDHHADARAAEAVYDPTGTPAEEALRPIDRERARIEKHLRALTLVAMDVGVPRELLTLAVPGSALASPAALALAHDHRLLLPVPPPSAGTLSIWRQVGHGRGLSGGSHWDLLAGGPPWGFPLRNAHAVQTARAALAAGARDYTVVMGCAGDRWAGGLLDERAVPRASARAWRELNQQAAALPTGEDHGVKIVVSAEDIARARAEAAVRPLPQGLLAWLGATPGSLSEPSSVTGSASTWRSTVENGLTEAGVPWRWTSGSTTEACDDVDAVIARDVASHSQLAVPSTPRGRVLVRAVGDVLVVLSAWDEPVRLHPPEGWTGDGVVVGPGEVTILTREGGSG